MDEDLKDVAKEPEEDEDGKKSAPPPAVAGKWDSKHIMAYAAVIASVAGLGNSWVAYRKAQTEQVARDSYKTVTLAIDRLSDESKMNHDELVGLRKYLADHISANASALAQPQPDPPPEIATRPAPIQVTGKLAGHAPVASTAASAPMPLPSMPVTASSSSPPRPPEVKKNLKAAAPPAQMPAEWPSP